MTLRNSSGLDGSLSTEHTLWTPFRTRNSSCRAVRRSPAVLCHVKPLLWLLEGWNMESFACLGPPSSYRGAHVSSSRFCSSKAHELGDVCHPLATYCGVCPL